MMNPAALLLVLSVLAAVFFLVDGANRGRRQNHAIRVTVRESRMERRTRAVGLLALNHRLDAVLPAELRPAPEPPPRPHPAAGSGAGLDAAARLDLVRAAACDEPARAPVPFELV
jgi:hypothetical protein